MGRAHEAIRRRDLSQLFTFFGLQVEPALVEAHRVAIASRFAAEAGAIAQLCSGLRERERFQLLREALRLSYKRALLQHGAPA